MFTRHIGTFFLFGFLFCRGLAAQQEQPLPDGYKVASPDGRFVAQLVEDFFPTEYDRHPTQKITCLSVEDRQSRATALVGVLSPVFVVSWTKDSQSIVTVEHLAGGTQAAVSHYQEGKWQRHEVEPLSEDQTGHYAVTRLKLGQSSFEVTYKVADNSVTNDVDFYLCKFRIDASTGAVVHTEPRREITSNTYMHTVLRIHR